MIILLIYGNKEMESNKSDLESFCGVIRTQKDTVFFDMVRDKGRIGF